VAVWRKVTVGDFLFEREGRYKPDALEISGLQRIDKIDFSGNFHIANKPSKTDMILIKPGDLVISGINVAKGALGVYHGHKDVTATIHYSSYTFDESKVSVEYFKRFLKSTLFVQLLKEQVKGGIKTEIKPKHLLPLEILLPDKQEQLAILSKFQCVENEDGELKTELTHQQTLLKKLRQQILQEAIEGKLTADWRKYNSPLMEGWQAEPDGVVASYGVANNGEEPPHPSGTPPQEGNWEPASELLKRIAAEKAQLVKDKKIKAQKPLPQITDEEKPFELPQGWEWCRFQEVTYLITDGKHGDCQNLSGSGYYFLSAKDIQKGELLYLNARQIVPDEFFEVHQRTDLSPGDICMVNTGATVGKLAIAPDSPMTQRTTFQKSVAVIKVAKPLISEKFIGFFLTCETSKLLATSWGSAINNLGSIWLSGSF
jgi:type I restriction enzyme S subunit